MTAQIPKETNLLLDELGAKVLYTRTTDPAQAAAIKLSNKGKPKDQWDNIPKIYLAAIIDKTSGTVYAQGTGETELDALAVALKAANKPGARPLTPLEELHKLRTELAEIKGEALPPEPIKPVVEKPRPTRGSRVNVAQIS